MVTVAIPGGYKKPVTAGYDIGHNRDEVSYPDSNLQRARRKRFHTRFLVHDSFYRIVFLNSARYKLFRIRANEVEFLNTPIRFFSPRFGVNPCETRYS
jgi:hypothetical protein